MSRRRISEQGNADEQGSANDPESKPISVAELMARAKEHGHDAAERIAHSGRRHGGGKDAVSVAELTGEIPKFRDSAPSAPATAQPAPGPASSTPPQPTPPAATRDISADAIADRATSSGAAAAPEAYSQSSGSRGPDPLSGLSADEREREFERYRNFEDVDHDEHPVKKRGLFGRRRHKDHETAGHDAAPATQPETAVGSAAPKTEGIATPAAPVVEPERPAAPSGAPTPAEPITGPVNLGGAGTSTWRRPAGPPPSSDPTPPRATGRFPVSGDRPLTGAGTFPASPPLTGATGMPADVPPTGPISSGPIGAAAADHADDVVDDVDSHVDDADADDNDHSGAATGVAAAAGATAAVAGTSALRRRRRNGGSDDSDEPGLGAVWDADDDQDVAKAADKTTTDKKKAAGDKKSPPALTWAGLAGQIALGLLVGVGLFWGFTELWKWNTYFALVLTVVVVLAMVSLVYALRRTSDLISVLLALAAGLIVTVGPLAILGEWPK